MNRKLKLANDFSDKTWSLTCAFISSLNDLYFCVHSSPTVSNKIQTDLGRSTRLHFQLIFSLAIRFCFRLAYYTILTVKVKQGTLKTIEASKSDQKQDM